MQTVTSVTFASLSLAEPIQRALADKGYQHPSPIQAQAIPHLLQGRDLIGLAQTGTGKTAAFSLPMLDRLSRNPAARQPRRPRALVLAPTRELAIQVGESISTYGRHLGLRHTLMFGGVGEHPQIKSVTMGTDILVATPGRLLDLMNQGHVHLDRVEVFVLDEADRMLDMGFAPDVKRVVARLPVRRQSLLFSATMPESIRALAASLLTNPVTVEVAPVGTTAERVEQRLCYVPKSRKHELLVHLLGKYGDQRVLVFTRTKHGADRLAKHLIRDGYEADAIHGNKGQGARQRALKNFADGSVPILIATDIAARGIDVKEIGLVVNYELPDEPEAYVHRIGRTARAGAEGLAIAFCDAEERANLRDIQRLIRAQIPVETDHPYAVEGEAVMNSNGPSSPAGRGGGGRGHNRPVHISTAGPGRHGRAPGQRRAPHAHGHASHGGSGDTRLSGGAAPAAPAEASPAPKRGWGGLFRFGRR